MLGHGGHHGPSSTVRASCPGILGLALRPGRGHFLFDGKQRINVTENDALKGILKRMEKAPRPVHVRIKKIS